MAWSSESRLSVLTINIVAILQLVSPQPSTQLDYDYYHTTCPKAEQIVRNTMVQIVKNDSRVPAQLLRVMFHDCFIQGCDASLLLDDSRGNTSRLTERDALPNQTLKGFDHIDTIKQELEKRCPGVVSCADIIVLAVRDGIVLLGGPFYPVLTGRKDSLRSFYDKANTEIPAPDDDAKHILNLFSSRGFNERETVSLFGAHNIGKIGCGFLYNRLFNFRRTGQPDPSIPLDFLTEMRSMCQRSSRTTITRTTTADDDDDDDGNSSSSSRSSRSSSSSTSSTIATQLLHHHHHHRDAHRSSSRSRWEAEFDVDMASSSIEAGNLFDSHYYENLTRGRGLLFADQQLMAHPRTAELVRALASDEGFTFRREFVKAMIKMSNIGALTGAQGEVRAKCSLPN